MGLRIFQKGFNYSQDGPGNRLVYHLQGCNLHCPWCSNPEGMSHNGGTEYSIDQLMDEVERSRMMFFDGGGVTLTGGEVTTQFSAANEFLTALHAAGIHTCIETNGMSRRLPELFPVLDLLIMDIKHHDAQIHESVTGISNELTVHNITAALDAQQPLALRIPLIGGFNASDRDAYLFARLFSNLKIGCSATIELLPYHEYGKSKYSALGMQYGMTDSARVTISQVEHFKQILQDAGFSIIKT